METIKKYIILTTLLIAMLLFSEASGYVNSYGIGKFTSNDEDKEYLMSYLGLPEDYDDIIFDLQSTRDSSVYAWPGAKPVIMHDFRDYLRQSDRRQLDSLNNRILELIDITSPDNDSLKTLEWPVIISGQNVELSRWISFIEQISLSSFGKDHPESEIILKNASKMLWGNDSIIDDRRFDREDLITAAEWYDKNKDILLPKMFGLYNISLCTPFLADDFKDYLPYLSDIDPKLIYENKTFFKGLACLRFDLILEESNRYAGFIYKNSIRECPECYPKSSYNLFKWRGPEPPLRFKGETVRPAFRLDPTQMSREEWTANLELADTCRRYDLRDQIVRIDTCFIDSLGQAFRGFVGRLREADSGMPFDSVPSVTDPAYDRTMRNWLGFLTDAAGIFEPRVEFAFSPRIAVKADKESVADTIALSQAECALSWYEQRKELLVPELFAYYDLSNDGPLADPATTNPWCLLPDVDPMAVIRCPETFFELFYTRYYTFVYACNATVTLLRVMNCLYPYDITECGATVNPDYVEDSGFSMFDWRKRYALPIEKSDILAQ